jgi:mRNA interferase MazF
MITEQRDIFLVPFPFSDFSGNKVRPVLILSKNTFNNTSEDVIVCGITSNTRKSQYTHIIETCDLEEGILFVKSAVKIENILKIDKKLFIKKIGKIKKQHFNKIIKKLYSLFEE